MVVTTRNNLYHKQSLGMLTTVMLISRIICQEHQPRKASTMCLNTMLRARLTACPYKCAHWTDTEAGARTICELTARRQPLSGRRGRRWSGVATSPSRLPQWLHLWRGQSGSPGVGGSPPRGTAEASRAGEIATCEGK